ncbi:MAG: hypothetical protein QW203_07225, partial [Thermoplasmatales archaeon]
YTYKITLSNTTSTATPPNLQVRLNINFASLVSNINADLGNIRFSSDQAGNNLLYAWLESAPQGTFTQGTNVSSYTSSNVWVNLGNNIIPANGSLNIYMQILSSGTEFDGVYWGANPLWTSTYGQYDNGANVFNNYWNFAGTSLPSGWQEPQTAGVTVDNGVSFAPGSNHGYIETTAKYPIGDFVDANFDVTTIGYGGLAMTVDINGNAYTSDFWLSVGTASGYMYNGTVADLRSSGGSASVLNSSYTGTSPFDSTGSFIGSVVTTSSEYYIYKNYNTLVGDTTTNIPPQGNYYIMVGGGGNGVVFSINWIRTRTYPPNGTDPVLASIQILLLSNYTSASTSVTEWSVLNGKPYVIVSPKGISNGLSNIPNDGADFGPDTLLGASSPNQYGPPYTQTSGIQEAGNCLIANGGGKMFLKAGLYYIDVPISFDTYYGLEIEGVISEFSTGHPFVGTGTIILPSSVYPSTNQFLLTFINSNSTYPNMGALHLHNFAILGNYISVGTDITPVTSTSASGIQIGSSTTVQDSVPYQVLDNIYIYGCYYALLTFNLGGPSIYTNIHIDQSGPINADTIATGYVMQLNNLDTYLSNIELYNIFGYIPVQILGTIYGLLYKIDKMTIVYSPNNKYNINVFYITGNPETNDVAVSLDEVYIGVNNLSASSPQPLPSIFQFANTGTIKVSVGSLHVAQALLEAAIIANSTPSGIVIMNISNLYYPFLQYLLGNNTFPAGSVLNIGTFYNYNTGTFVRSTINSTGMTFNVGLFEPSETTVSAPTSGTVVEKLVTWRTYYTKYIFNFSAYENNTTTNQSINFPIPFSTVATITTNTTGLTISATTSGITITAPNSTTTYSGIVIVEGY